MTILEIIYDIKEKLKEYVDDTRYTDEYLLFEIDKMRSTLIRQQYDRLQRSVDEQIIQNFIMEVEEVDDLFPYSSTTNNEKEYIRTKIKLPRVIELGHRNMLESITLGSVFSESLNIVSNKRFAFSGNGDFDEDQIFVTLYNNYIYFKSKSCIEFTHDFIEVSAVLERPLEVLSFDSTQSNSTIETFQYPISSTLAMVIVDEIVSKLANLKKLPTDKENNSADDATIN